MTVLILNALVNGILLGGVLALLAFGMNLIFGVVKVIHMAYGQSVMLGMYVIYALTEIYSFPLILSCLIALIAMTLLGGLMHLLIIQKLLTANRLNQLLALAGLIIVYENFAQVVWGADLRGIPIFLPVFNIGSVFIKTSNLIAFIGSLVVLGLLYFFLHKTYIGLAIRATAQDVECAKLMGINPKRIYLTTMMVGGAMTGVIAGFFTPIYSVHPHFGGSFTMMAFIIVVLGGMGNLMGGFIGAFIIAIVTSLTGALASIEAAEIVALIIFVLVVLVRPQGLMGGKQTR